MLDTLYYIDFQDIDQFLQQGKDNKVIAQVMMIRDK